MPNRRSSRSRRSRSRRSRSRRSANPPRFSIQLPPIEKCMRNYRRSKKYCGSKNRIPSGYRRKGTQYECLKKGFGAGRCSVYRFE
jgi:hypothetical protein